MRETTQQKKLEILKSILGPFHRQGQEYLFFCPASGCNHHKPKLSINIERNKGKCWICSWSASSLLRVVASYGNISQVREWRELEGSSGVDFADLFAKAQNNAITQCKLPSDFKFMGDIPKNHQAWRYLEERGLDIKDAIRYRLGICFSYWFRDRIIFPSFDVHGKCNFFTGRLFVERPGMSYLNCDVDKNLVIFNDLFIDWKKPIVIVEGPFDMVKAGENAIPLLGSTLDEESVLFQKIIHCCPEVLIGLDPDAQKKELRIAKQLSLYGVSVKKVPILPFKDAGVMTKEDFAERKTKAYQIDGNTLKERLNGL